MVDASVFFAAGVALLVALVLGEFVERAGEPAILGEILAGVLLGTAVLGVVSPDGPFGLLAAIGSMLLLFDAGYEELDVSALRRGGAAVAAVALFGVLGPALAGTGVGLAFGYDRAASAVLGIAIGVTSIGVSARTFIDLDCLDRPFGIHVVGAAVAAEVVGLVAASLLLAVVETGIDPGRLASILGLVAAFFLGAWAFARYLVGPFASVLSRSRQRGADLIGIVGVLFLFGYAADAAGLDVVVGGLLAGLAIGSQRRFERGKVRTEIGGIAYGVFIPLFFVNVGAQLDPASLLGTDPFVLAVVATGVLAKIGGGYVGARLAGHPGAEALVVGVGLLPRAGVELVVVTSALAAGVVDERLFSAVLALVLVSVVATPVLLKRAVARLDDVDATPRTPRGSW